VAVKLVNSRRSAFEPTTSKNRPFTEIWKAISVLILDINDHEAMIFIMKTVNDGGYFVNDIEAAVVISKVLDNVKPA